MFLNVILKNQVMPASIFYTGKHNTSGSLALLILRLVSGGIMLARHGYGKIGKLLAGPPYEFRDPIGLGSDLSFILTFFAEVICAVLVIIGLGTRLAVVPLIITMAVVAFIVHPPDGFFAMELPIMYLTMYIMLLLMGAGKFSLDRALETRK